MTLYAVYSRSDNIDSIWTDKEKAIERKMQLSELQGLCFEVETYEANTPDICGLFSGELIERTICYFQKTV